MKRTRQERTVRRLECALMPVMLMETCPGFLSSVERGVGATAHEPVRAETPGQGVA